MEKKLTLKELSSYLPYGLKILNTHTNQIYDLEGRVIDRVVRHNDLDKPILRQLSDFEDYFKELFDTDAEVRKFLNEGFLTEENQFDDIEDMVTNYYVQWWPYGVVELALKHHFDVYGLIEYDLAVSFNDVDL